MAIKISSLKNLPLESLTSIYRNWKGIQTEMTFQPMFPIVFGGILSTLVSLRQSPTLTQDIVSSAIAGSLSGPVANVMTTIIIRLQHHPSESAIKAVRQIFMHSGPSEFLRGSNLMSLRNAGFAGVFFGVNPQLINCFDNNITLPYPYKGLVTSLCAAIPSAALACLFTMPPDNLSVLRQASCIGTFYPSSIP